MCSAHIDIYSIVVSLERSDKPFPGPCRDFVGYGGEPPRVRWPDDAAVAVSFVVNYEEGGEPSFPMGDEQNADLTETPNYTLGDQRDLGAESMYEYGSRTAIYRVLDLFREHDLPTTFFASAVALERNPKIARLLMEDGHEPCSHGWKWERAWQLDRDQERERLAETVKSFERLCGRRPVGIYNRYAPSLNTRELLVEEGGFLYDSDYYGDDLPFFTEVLGKDHLVIPYTLVYNDARYVLAQGFSRVSDFTDLVVRALDDLRREAGAGYPKMISIGLHPRLIGVPGRMSGLREIVEHIVAAGDCWVATREQIANWWIDNHESWEQGSNR